MIGYLFKYHDIGLGSHTKLRLGMYTALAHKGVYLRPCRIRLNEVGGVRFAERPIPLLLGEIHTFAFSHLLLAVRKGIKHQSSGKWDRMLSLQRGTIGVSSQKAAATAYAGNKLLYLLHHSFASGLLYKKRSRRQ
jgi:hypothetical protein